METATGPVVLLPSALVSEITIPFRPRAAVSLVLSTFIETRGIAESLPSVAAATAMPAAPMSTH